MRKRLLNSHLQRCVLKHRDQKYFEEHFGRRNIGTDPRKFPLFSISRILVSFRNCFLFYAVKTALEPDINWQIHLSGLLSKMNILPSLILVSGGVNARQTLKLTIWESALRAQEIPLRMWETIIGLFFRHFQGKFLRNLASEIIIFCTKYVVQLLRGWSSQNWPKT